MHQKYLISDFAWSVEGNSVVKVFDWHAELKDATGATISEQKVTMSAPFGRMRKKSLNIRDGSLKKTSVLIKRKYGIESNQALLGSPIKPPLLGVVVDLIFHNLQLIIPTKSYGMFFAF
jgi:hypothetical protein